MLILKFILRILRPKIAPSPRKKQLPLSVTLYKRLLSMLAGYYRKYAAVDTVTIGRDIKIIRSRRDENFENELKRMSFDVKAYMDEVQLHKLVKAQMPRGRKPFISYFEFKDELYVSYAGSEILIDRTEDLELSGPSDVKARCSSTTDFILRSQLQFPTHKGHKAYEAENLQEAPVFTDEDIPVRRKPAQPEVPQKQRWRPIKSTSFFGGEQVPIGDPEQGQKQDKLQRRLFAGEVVPTVSVLPEQPLSTTVQDAGDIPDNLNYTTEEKERKGFKTKIYILNTTDN